MIISRPVLYGILLSWWYCFSKVPKSDGLWPLNVAFLAFVSAYLISVDITGMLARKNDEDPPKF